MFSDINILHIILFLIGGLIIYIIRQGFRPITPIFIGMPGKPQRRIGHLDYETEEQAGEIRFEGGDNLRPIARTATHDKLDATIIRILHGSINDEENLSDYRMRGYITQEGYIYRQFNKIEDPQVVGYTARPSAPNVPTTKGERSWRSLWLNRTLIGVLGIPGEKENAVKNTVTTCYLDGFSFLKKGRISTESKACAFAVLYGLYHKKEKENSIYKENSYGWNDTALTAAILFSLLFLCIYLISVNFFQVGLIGYDIKSAIIFALFYHAIWALVRNYKIYSIEEGHSIQSQLDLINKSVGLSGFDIIAEFAAFLGLWHCYNTRNYDFLPILYAIILGIGKNGYVKNNKRPWDVYATYQDDNIIVEEEFGKNFANLTPPKGEICKQYTWNLDPSCGRNLQGSLKVNFSIDYITILREENPYYQESTHNNKAQKINQMIHTATSDHSHKERVVYIARYIESICQQEHVEEMDQLQFTLDFVQEPNIEFRLGNQSKSIQYDSKYLRMPDETLFDQEGSFDCKALLAAMLLQEQGHDTLFVASTMKEHAGAAIKVDSKSWIGKIYNLNDNDYQTLTPSFIEHNNHQYLYCETSGDGYKIGQFPEGIGPNDFDIKVEMIAEEENEEVINGGFTI